MKRAAILAILTDELEAIKDPKYEPLPGTVGVVIKSMMRDVLSLEQCPLEEINAASMAAVTRQAGRYSRTGK